MPPVKFNIDRTPLSDEEINKHKNFDSLVQKFKQESLKKAQGDETWWKNKKISYSAIIAGITVVCSITYLTIQNAKQQKTKKNETITTTANTNLTKKKPYLKAPSTKLALPYSSYKINAGKNEVITHSTSTKLKVPANSLVDKNGKQLVGEVTITYKEIHDMGDVIMSGIPMKYDSAGTKYQFETAGMFDIRAYQNGEPVFMKPGEQIEVRLVSQNNQDRFNQYYLDTINQNWSYLRKDELVSASLPSKSGKTIISKPQERSNEKLIQLQNEWKVVIPAKIDSVGKLYSQKAKALPKPLQPNHPAKATEGRPIFVIEASAQDFPELAAYENMVFEVGTENANYSKELHNITWSDVRISQGPNKGKNYILQLIYRNRSEKLVVYPVFTEKNYPAAQVTYQKQFEKYQGLLKEKQVKEEKLMEEMRVKQAVYIADQEKKKAEYEKEKAKREAIYQANLQNELNTNFNSLNDKIKAERIFRINAFGIYNSDCPHPIPNANALHPLFVINENKLPITPDLVYLVDHDTKVVSVLTLQDGFKLTYDNNKTYSICLFKNGNAYICNKTSFADAVQNSGKKFGVSPLLESTDNQSDFKKALEL